MSRTVMTAATTALLSLLALVLFGGEAIEGFAAGHALRRGDRHLFGDLHLVADPDLYRPARARTRRCRRRKVAAAE